MNTVVTHPSVFRLDAPYSGALRVGDLLFISGTVALDEEGNLVGPGDLEAQTRQVFVNIERLLEAAGAGWGQVAMLTYYLADISRWSSVSALRREFLSEPYPAATAVEVSRLVNTDWLIEIEALAVLGSSR
jgi:reactive intermediate/imine deaminase